MGPSHPGVNICDNWRQKLVELLGKGGRQQTQIQCMEASYDPMSPNQNKSYPVSQKRAKGRWKELPQSGCLKTGLCDWSLLFSTGFTQKNTLKQHLKWFGNMNLALLSTTRSFWPRKWYTRLRADEVFGGWCIFVKVRQVSGPTAH